MRSVRLFLSIFLLSLWVMLFGAFLFMIAFESREGGVTMPMAGVAIRPETGFAAIDLPNRVFICTTTAQQQKQCQTTIQDRPLVVTIKPLNGASTKDNCRAQYDGRSIRCDTVELEYAPMLSPSLEVKGLGLSAQEFQRVRQKYWITQTMVKAGEQRLLRISMGLSLVGGAISAYFALLHPSLLSKGIASIAVGFLIYWLARILLGRVVFTLIAPYGFTTVEPWLGVVSIGEIAASVGAAIAFGFWLWQRSPPAIKPAIILSSGIGTVLILNYFFLMLLCGSGFVD